MYTSLIFTRAGMYIAIMDNCWAILSALMDGGTCRCMIKQKCSIGMHSILVWF